MKEAGSPKETTNADRKHRSDKFKSAMNKVTLEYRKMKERADGSLPRNSFKNLIAHTAIKCDALEASLKNKSIHSRFNRKSLSPEHPGVKSTMHKTEQHLVNVHTHLWKMSQPLSLQEGLKFDNSLVKDSAFEQ